MTAPRKTEVDECWGLPSLSCNEMSTAENWLMIGLAIG